MKLPFQTRSIICAVSALSLASCSASEPAPTEELAETSSAEPAVAEPVVTEPAAVEDAEPSKQAAAPADIIRGPGGLEEKCLARVNQETGGNAIGTNRISESEAAIEIYVNVDGATAPWKCLGWRNGTIAEVMFTGSEGAL